MNTTNSAERLSQELDRALATSIVAERPQDQFFIGEAMILGSATFLLLEYSKGFFKGLGLADAAEEHGQLARTYLGELRSGKPMASHPEVLDRLEKALSEVRAHRGSAEARLAGEAEVAAVLRSFGAVPRQAEDAAKEVTRSIDSGDA